jgi:hypothetical protein
MHQGKPVFAQLMVYLPLSMFRRFVANHRGEHKVKDFSCLDQFFAMAFAQLNEAKAFFVTHVKSNTKFKRRYSHPVDRIHTMVLCDRTGVLTTHYSSKDYPTTLHRVVLKDETGKRQVFLTNNFALKLELVAELHRQLWQVELLFT